MQQKLAEKEKAQKEENLRMLAQRAREERAGIPTSRPADNGKATAERTAAMQSSLNAYGSDSESDGSPSEDSDDEDAAKIRTLACNTPSRSKCHVCENVGGCVGPRRSARGPRDWPSPRRDAVVSNS